MLKYYLIFAALLAAFLAGCTVDTRTTPMTVTVDEARAVAAWDRWMLRRAALQRELDNPATDAARRQEVMDILKAENDLIAFAASYLNLAGGQFKIDVMTEERGGGNIDTMSGTPR